MTNPKTPSLGALLQHPEVKQATSNINTELRERRAFVPPNLWRLFRQIHPS